MDEVTVVIPYFETPELIRLCLRSIRRYTPRPPRVIVVNNHSREETLEYLRGLSWIELVDAVDEPAGLATAVQQAWPMVSSPFFLTLHSDAIPIRPDWLDFLLREMRRDARVAAVGSGLMHPVPRYQAFVKSYLRPQALLWYLRGAERSGREPWERFRLTCALLRSEAIVQAGVRFAEKGRSMNLVRQLLAKGLRYRYVSDYRISKYVFHLRHGTKYFTEQRLASGMQRRTRDALAAFLRRPAVREILADDSLDG